MTHSFHSYNPADGHRLSHDPLNAIVGPRPIGWISTMSPAGEANLAPYSFFNAFNYTPPIIGFSSTGPKDSLFNARETREFVWNLATRPLAEKMNTTASALPHGTDEFEVAGLTKLASERIKSPRVAESPVHFECLVTEIVHLKNHTGSPVPAWLVIGEVVMIHIRDDKFKDGLFDTFGADIILRAGGPSAYLHVRPESRFDVMRPT